MLQRNRNSAAKRVYIKIIAVLCACVFTGCYAASGVMSELEYALSEKDAPGTWYSLDAESYDSYKTSAMDPAVTQQQNPNLVQPDVTVKPSVTPVIATPAPEKIETPAQFADEYVNSLNRTTVHLLSTAPAAHNFAFSAPTLSMLLGMMLYPASEPAAAAINKTIGNGLSIPELAGNARLMQKALSSAGIDIRLSAILNAQADESDVFDDVVQSKIIANYGAEVHAIDYGMTHYGITEINRFINAGTTGKITKTIDEIDEGAHITLLGALCASEAWDTVFSQGYMTTRTFDSPEAGVYDAPMYTTSGVFKYAEYANGLVLSTTANSGKLTYIFGEAPVGIEVADYASVVLSNNYAEFEASYMTDKPLSLSIPQINAYSAYELSSNMRSMGLGDAMEGGAGNFLALTKENTYHAIPAISNIYSGIAVVVRATEVSTAALPQSLTPDSSNTGLLVPTNDEVVFDTPYFVAVVHNDTGCIVAVSLVSNPRKGVE